MFLLGLLWGCNQDPTVYGPGKTAVDTTAPTGTDTARPTPTPTPTPTPSPTTETAAPALFTFDGAPPRNVLYLSIDTLRRDVFARYGGSSAPAIDQLISEGVVLDDLRQCANWTLAGTLCGVSGGPGQAAGYLPHLGADPSYTIPPSVVMLPEVLKDAGYRTGLVWSNGFLDSGWGIQQGFDHVTPAAGGAAARVFDEGIALLSSQLLPSGQPWYLHLHFYDPHAAYNPPAGYLGGLGALDPVPWDLADRDQHYEARDDWPSMTPAEQDLLEAHLRVRYLGDVRWMDDTFATKLATLDAMGALDDTLVVLWADHGEGFWEHGTQTHAHHLYEEETTVVGVFWAKNLRHNAFDGPASAIDLAPTVLDLLDLPRPPSWVGLPLDEIPTDRPRFLTARARQGLVVSVLDGHDRLQVYLRDGRVVWTNAESDPQELVNLYTDPTDPRLLELWSLLLPEAERSVAIGQETGLVPIWPADLPR